MKHVLLIFIFINVLFGCANTDVKDTTADWSAQRIYKEAHDSMKSGDNATAIKYYEALEARYPFNRYAEQAQLETIYAYYKSDEPESAIVAADRFIKLYPRHINIDYVYYLKGLINFDINAGLFDRFMPLDKSQRDQSSALHAFQAFSEVVTRFPNSKYSADSRQRMLYLRNNLARHELQVAKFYLQRGAYIAAANRAKKIIESYQRTPSVPDAMVVLAKSYKVMGLEDLYASTLKILKLNYPNHEGLREVETMNIKG